MSDVHASLSLKSLKECGLCYNKGKIKKCNKMTCMELESEVERMWQKAVHAGGEYAAREVGKNEGKEEVLF